MTLADVARFEGSAGHIVHCRFAPWETDEHLTHSAPNSIGLSFTSQTASVAIDGRSEERAVPSGGVVITGGKAPAWLRVGQASELIEIAAAPALLSALADDLRIPAELGDISYGDDPICWAIAAHLRRRLRSRENLGPLEAAQCVQRLYAHVLMAQFGGRAREKGRGVLSKRRIGQVTDYIEDHIGANNLALDALAAVAALSPFHFHRSFVRTFGCSPHAYVGLRRVSRAHDLIRAGASVKRAADDAGFASVRQMRHAFALKLGLKI